MAARTRKVRHDENTRLRIQATQIVNRLQDHIFDRCELSRSQVSAALGLLKKTLPDLQATELSGPDGEAIPIGVDVRIVSGTG